MRATNLVDELDALVRNAKPIPLTTQVRLDKDDLYDVLDELRAVVPEEIKDGWLPQGAVAVLPHIDALDDFVHDAKTVPLTDQIRVDEDELEALVARIRAALA